MSDSLPRLRRKEAKMAAVIGTDLVTITINDVDIQVPKGELIVESVKRLGLEIPIFCYHPRMKPVGMCRMCLVEVGFKQPDGSVRKMPKPQAGCTLPASDGMVVFTDTEMVHKDRKGVLEFLLINHPLDCPICDRGGECPLQNNTVFCPPGGSRYIEIKRHLPKAFPLSKYVTLDLERCIQCGRCVRFTEEISGDSQLAFRFRGAQMQPSTFQLLDFESKFSGNVIEICPVGALTSAKYRFRARPWDLETKPSICLECSNGCNVWFDHRASKFVRINGRTNEAVNEEWTCDQGKFGHDWYNDPRRLIQPLIRAEAPELTESAGEAPQAFRPARWADAYDVIAPRFQSQGSRVGVLAGSKISNEGYFLLQKLVREQMKSNNLDHRWTNHLTPREARLEHKFGVNPRQFEIAEIESFSSILVFGGSLADDLPIVFLRVRKAWFQNGCKVVVASSQATDVDSFAHLSLIYRPGSEAALAAGLLHLLAPQTPGVARWTPEAIQEATGVPAAKLREAAEALRSPGMGIVTSHEMLNKPKGPDALEVLAGLAHQVGGRFSVFSCAGNDQGAADLGVLPDTVPGGARVESPGLDTRAILGAAAEGQLDALWLAGCNPFELWPDRDLVTRALENVPFLVVQDSLETEAMAYASVVLPMEAPAEQDGTYTNCEGRVQRLRKVIEAPGDAKEAWRTYQELSLRLHPQAPLFNPSEVLGEISAQVPGYPGPNHEGLLGEGVVVPELGSNPDFSGLESTLGRL